MHEEWTDKLSEYLDEELSREEQAAVAAHLRECAACAAVLDDLKQVVARARALDVRPPQADLWPGVAEHIERGTGFRGDGKKPVPLLSFTMPQAIAASLVIALLSGAAMWQIAGRSAQASRSTQSAAATNTPAMEREPSGERSADRSASADAVTVGFADAQYDAAVADLEKALKEGRGRLDKTTVAIVEHNLQIIDQAIEQARQALEADPANDYLSGHLVEARRRKLDLLRRATALTNDTD
jgi:tetratricopeptide (TPR) repeat protein